MKRILTLYLIIFSTFEASAQNKLALLIGIGEYPQDSGWPTIHGDNDVAIIKNLLIGQDFKEDDICELTNSAATKVGIMSALESILQEAKQGDVVYIHFSGHGQQVTDLDGDEDDHYDEAWIPYDARKKYEADVYEGENPIIDDELNSYLNRLRTKVGVQGKIIVVADACHSGSGSRGISDEEVFVRGTSEKFEIPVKKLNIVRKEAPVHWLYVGACKPYQTNYEFKSNNGTYYGSLSYVISNDSEDLATSTYSEVINLWKKAMVEISRYPQDIDDEGRPSRKTNTLF